MENFNLFAVVLAIIALICINKASANECVPCPPASTGEAVCTVNEIGQFEKFGSECLMRFENCSKKTSKKM